MRNYGEERMQESKKGRDRGRRLKIVGREKHWKTARARVGYEIGGHVGASGIDHDQRR